MSEFPLMLRNDAALSLEFTPQAARLKREALELSAQIGKVADAASNLRAVAAQTELAQLVKLVEEARVAAKDPVLIFGRNIDAAAKAFTEELREEQWRLSRLVGDFQQLEQAKARAAQAAENERLAAIERERAKELAKATTHEELDKVQEKFDARAQQGGPVVLAPQKADNQTVREDWQYEVFDIWALARAHPGCIKIEGRALEIKSALKAGVNLAGVRAWKVTTAGVRLPRQTKAIEA